MLDGEQKSRSVQLCVAPSELDFLYGTYLGLRSPLQGELTLARIFIPILDVSFTAYWIIFIPGCQPVFPLFCVSKRGC